MMGVSHLIAVRLAPYSGALKAIFADLSHLIAVTFIYLPCMGSALLQLQPLLFAVIARPF